MNEAKRRRDQQEFEDELRDPQEGLDAGTTLEELNNNLNDKEWVKKNWLKLGGDLQRMALEIHGMNLWDEVLGL